MIFLFGFVIVAIIACIIIVLDPMLFGCECRQDNDYISGAYIGGAPSGIGTKKPPKLQKPIRALENSDQEKIYNEDEFIAQLKKERYDQDEIDAITKIIPNHKYREPMLANLESLKYRKPRKNAITYRKHIGQRKLLMNEVIFLTQYGHLANTVVYAGAAPGQHTPLLLELFPDIHFELWDPAPFEIKEGPRIKIYNEYFTNESAAKYAGKRVLFISDIRSASSTMSYTEFEEQVTINNQYQIDWVGIMKPVMSMLKFRLPFTVDKYDYFDGKIYLQPWAPLYSAETRLITDGKTHTQYTLSEYEDKMYYFNTVIREFQTIPHDIDLDTVEGLCYCYDCNFEIATWKEFARKIKGFDNPVDVNHCVVDQMNSASKYIGRGIKLGLHGFLPTVWVANKRKQLEDQLILQESKKEIEERE